MRFAVIFVQFKFTVIEHFIGNLVHLNASLGTFVLWTPPKRPGENRNKSISVITLLMDCTHCDQRTTKTEETWSKSSTTDERTIENGRKKQQMSEYVQSCSLCVCVSMRKWVKLLRQRKLLRFYFYCHPNNPCAECRSIFQRIKYLCEAFIWIICLTNFYGFQRIRIP